METELDCKRKLIQDSAKECDRISRKNTMKYVITIICHVSVAIIAANRSTLSMAILNISKIENQQVWTSEQKGLVLGAFFWGYVLTMIPCGIFATIKSPVKFFFISNVINSSLTLLSPYVVINLDYRYFAALRMIIGMIESSDGPIIYAIIQNWSTKYTKTRMTSFAVGGFHLGSILSFPINGFLMDRFNWKYSFYFFGTIGLLWSIVWYVVVSDEPEMNRFISRIELDELKSQNETINVVKFTEIPLKAILMSPEIWIIAITSFCDNWTHYLMVLDLPLFLKNCLNFDLINSSFLSFLPNMSYYVVIILSGQILDFLIIRKFISVKRSRKMATCLGLTVEAICLAISTYSSDPMYFIICACIGYGLAGMSYSGFRTEILEISKPYSAFIFSITNTFGNMPGILVPTVSGMMTKNDSKEEWNMVFYIAVAISFIGSIIYGCFATNKVQNWAHP